VRSFRFDGRGEHRDGEVLAPADDAAVADFRVDVGSGAAADLIEQPDADTNEQPEHEPFTQPLAVGHGVGQFWFQHLGQRHVRYRYRYVGHGHIGYRYRYVGHVGHRDVRVDGAGHRIAEQRFPRSQRLAVQFHYDPVWYR
jgi:hypothetical protein